jgi:hypothetical protein
MLMRHLHWRFCENNCDRVFNCCPCLGYLGQHCTNYDKSVASFCHQVAAWIIDIICDFYIDKYLKIVNNTTTNKLDKKLGIDLESLQFQKIVYVFLAKFKNNHILHIKISHRFPVATKLFIG